MCIPRARSEKDEPPPPSIVFKCSYGNKRLFVYAVRCIVVRGSGWLDTICAVNDARGKWGRGRRRIGPRIKITHTHIYIRIQSECCKCDQWTRGNWGLQANYLFFMDETGVYVAKNLFFSQDEHRPPLERTRFLMKRDCRLDRSRRSDTGATTIAKGPQNIRNIKIVLHVYKIRCLLIYSSRFGD